SARLTRRPAWEGLSELGSRLGVPELVELADGLGLAGTEGARLRDSLAARAASLREHELSEAEASAGSATEGMSAPLVAILAGFVALIGYPALAGVMGGCTERSPSRTRKGNHPWEPSPIWPPSWSGRGCAWTRSG